jgi:hypothetical protein
MAGRFQTAGSDLRISASFECTAGDELRANSFEVEDASGSRVETSFAPEELPGSVADDTFELTITTPRMAWSPDEPIEVTTSLAYLGQEPQSLSGLGGDIVLFEVEQLDGLIDTDGPPRDTVCGGSHDYAPGDVQAIPFHKSGSWDPGGPLGSFWPDWFDDPELRLPAGTYRIVAHALYGRAPRCDTSAQEAAVTIEVVDAVASEPAVDWGPLAVISEGGAPDAGLGPGTLSIGPECVTFVGDRGGEGVNLVWPSYQTTWRPARRQIVFEHPVNGTTVLSDGDRVTLGGMGLGGGSPEEADHVVAWLEDIWVQRPDPSCPTGLWHVGEVLKIVDGPAGTS